MEQYSEHIDELIQSRLCREITPTENEELERWAALSDENKQYIDRRYEEWFSAVQTDELASFGKDDAFTGFVERSDERQRKMRRNKLYRIVGFAASTIIAVCMISGLLYVEGQKNVKAQFGNIVVEAPQGSRTAVTLPDGTHVWLNAGSLLTYSQGYGVDDRNVRISGEGFFEVHKNKQIPFTVQSGDMKVLVTGTKFDFCDYKNESKAIVTLVEGGVTASATTFNSGDVLLQPEQRVTLDKLTHKIDVEGCEASKSRDWTEGKISFDGRNLKEIASLLSRAYGVHINITDSKVGNLCFYGDFTYHKQSIKEVLDALAGTGNIHYKMKGQDIIIYK